MRIAIAGASGRMGQMLIEAVLAADGLELAVALDRKDSASRQDAGARWASRPASPSPTTWTRCPAPTA